MPETRRRSRIALALGLTEDEYALVCEKQGGPPNSVELAMYSLLWSEHCAYKHSKLLLRTLPTEGEHVVMGPARTPARSTSAAAWCAPSRSSRTTIRARSNRSRGPRPVSAGSCATSSRSARGRSRCSTRCASVSRARSAAATCSSAPSRDRPLRQLDRRADDRRRGLLRGARTSTTAWSTRWPSGSRRESSWCAAPPPASAMR